MIDFNDVYEIRNVLNNKVIEKIEDDLGNVWYEAFKKLIASGVPPITLEKCKGANLVDYKIYGNSVQDGTPTPETPIEVESVGDYVETEKKYKIPVKVSPTLYNFNLENIDYITYNSGATSRYGFDLGVLEEGKYTFDFEYETRPTYVGLVKEVDEKTTSEYITTTATGRDETPFTFTSDGVTHFYIIFMSSTIKNLTQAQNHWKQVKVAFLQKDTKIQTNITNIYLNEPLRKIGDYADYIDFEKQKVIRKIYKENITTVSGKSSIAGTYAIFYSRINKNALLWGIGGSMRGGYTISNKFEQSKYYYEYMVSYPNIIQSHQTTSGAYIVAYTFDDSSINTVALAQEKIGNGFEINYVLEEEIPETIELPNIPTFKGTNIIEVDTNILPSNMEVIYYSKGKPTNEPDVLNETDNIVLNSILATDTKTELDITDTEINQILDEIIGG
jgi:hypothetical protein